MCFKNKSIALLVEIIVQMSTFFFNVSNKFDSKMALESVSENLKIHTISWGGGGGGGGGMPPDPLVICASHVTILSPQLKVL